MATTKGQLAEEALRMGDDVEKLRCFYQDQEGDIYTRTKEPIIACSFADLPEREFDDGHGGTEGEPCIAFSEKYVYIKIQYDGSEHFDAIPRHPKSVTWIPWPGG